MRNAHMPVRETLMEINMKRLIAAAAAVALMSGIGTAGAQAVHKNGWHNSDDGFTQRSVRLRSEHAAPLPNADLKYGPYPEYPQSPAGGGY
jgi:hypothetical protein